MNADDELPELLTPTEVGAMLRVHPKTVMEWCVNGDIVAKKVGRHLWRIKRADYVRFRDEGPPPREKGRRKAGRGKVGGPSRQRAAAAYLDRIGL